MNTDEKKQLDSIAFAPVIYPALIVPNGFLSPDRESMALWYYYLCARQTYEMHIVDPIYLEGRPDPGYSFRKTIERVAEIYGVRVENMVNAWPEVDMQCTAMDLPKLPDEEQYRFNSPIRIN